MKNVHKKSRKTTLKQINIMKNMHKKSRNKKCEIKLHNEKHAQ